MYRPRRQGSPDGLLFEMRAPPPAPAQRCTAFRVPREGGRGHTALAMAQAGSSESGSRCLRSEVNPVPIPPWPTTCPAGARAAGLTRAPRHVLLRVGDDCGPVAAVESHQTARGLQCVDAVAGAEGRRCVRAARPTPIQRSRPPPLRAVRRGVRHAQGQRPVAGLPRLRREQAGAHRYRERHRVRREHQRLHAQALEQRRRLRPRCSRADPQQRLAAERTIRSEAWTQSRSASLKCNSAWSPASRACTSLMRLKRSMSSSIASTGSTRWPCSRAPGWRRAACTRRASRDGCAAR